MVSTSNLNGGPKIERTKFCYKFKTNGLNIIGNP